MNPSTRFARSDLADAPLDRHVNVLVARLERKEPSLELRFDRSERIDYCASVFRADDLLRSEHRDMRARLRDVERPQAHVDVQRAIDRVEVWVRRFTKAVHCPPSLGLPERLAQRCTDAFNLAACHLGEEWQRN